MVIFNSGWHWIWPWFRRFWWHWSKNIYNFIHSFQKSVRFFYLHNFCIWWWSWSRIFCFWCFGTRIYSRCHCNTVETYSFVTIEQRPNWTSTESTIIYFTKRSTRWRQFTQVTLKMDLTPRGKTVPSGDVNKICFDDNAHTIHW